MYQFSQNLRNRLIEYFATQYKFSVTQEEADLYLDSLADLYGFFETQVGRLPPPR